MHRIKNPFPQLKYRQ